jgi:hypothetical protein
MVDPEPEVMPPAGEEIDIPEEAETPLHLRDNAMLQDPDEPPPEEITEAARKGLPVPPSPRVQEGETTPTIKGAESKGIPKAFGIPIEGDTVFIVDLSGSMNDKHGDSTRYLTIVNELIEAIRSLRDEDSFDIVAFSGAYSRAHSFVRQWRGTMQGADETRKQAAIDWLMTLVPDGGTPTLEALSFVASHYPASVENIVLVTDGLPDSQTEPTILAKIKEWMGGFSDGNLICISVGVHGLPFVKRLVDRVGGAYVEVQ